MDKLTSDPVRLRDLDGAWGTLAQDLAARAGSGPSPAQQASLLARLSADADAPASCTDAQARPHASASGPATLKLTLLGLALLLGFAALYLGLRAMQKGHAGGTHEANAHAEHLPAQPSPDAAPHESSALALAPQEAQAEEPAQAQPLRTPRSLGARRRSPAASTTVVASEPVRAAHPADELALLMRARRVLLNEPARSLALADEHARDYPRGTFVEEREVLAVEALLRLGEAQQALRRGSAFLRAHPGSAHRVRILELLQAP